MTLSDIVKNSDETAAFLAAIANSKRIKILCILLEGERSVGSLAEMVDLSQSALSQHLAKLRAQSIVNTRRDGQTIYYTVSSHLVREILEYMQNNQFSARRNAA